MIKSIVCAFSGHTYSPIETYEANAYDKVHMKVVKSKCTRCGKESTEVTLTGNLSKDDKPEFVYEKTQEGTSKTPTTYVTAPKAVAEVIAEVKKPTSKKKSV